MSPPEVPSGIRRRVLEAGRRHTDDFISNLVEHQLPAQYLPPPAIVLGPEGVAEDRGANSSRLIGAVFEVVSEEQGTRSVRKKFAETWVPLTRSGQSCPRVLKACTPRCAA